LSPTPIHMKYTDHLKKIADLQQEVERLRSGKPSDDEVLNYLVENAEAYFAAATALLKAREAQEQAQAQPSTRKG